MTRTRTLLLGLSVLVALAIGASFLLAGRSPGQDRDMVIIALPTEVTTLDPHMSATVGSTLSVLSNIYPTLTTRTPDLKLSPSLATDWATTAPNRWRFRLRTGARFANGEPIDARAVQWNIARVLAPDTRARIKPWFEQIAEVVVVDDATIEIVTARPYASLPEQLSMLMLLPPRWAATHTAARETMSGGPYALESRDGDRIALRRNPRFWGTPAPFARAEYRTIPSMTARVAALRAGEVDVITALPIREVERLRGLGIAADVIPGIRSVFIKINTEKRWLDDIRVRQALNFAIDKAAIGDTLFAGRAPVSTCQLLTPDYLGYNPDLRPYPYDPARARKMLAEAGVPKGTRFELEIPVAYALQGEEVGQVIASQLHDVGIDVRIDQMETSRYMDKYLKGKDLGALSLLSHAWPTIDADGLLSLLSGKSPYAYYHDATFDALLTQGRETLDPDARRRIYAQATQRLCQTAPVIFLYVQPYSFATSAAVRWHARGDDWLRAYDMKPSASAKPNITKGSAK